MGDKHHRNIVLTMAVCLGFWCAAWASAASRGVFAVLQHWEFAVTGNLEGWRPNGHLSRMVVTNGVLSCQAVGSDPILEYSAPLAIVASPWQVLEIRLRANRPGTGEVFWSNTTEGRYGGYSQQMSTRFQVAGGKEWETCRIFPFWQAQKQIIKLRLDLYDGAEFEIDTISIVALPAPSVAQNTAWDFGQLKPQGWQVIQGLAMNEDLSVDVQPNGLFLKVFSPANLLLGPPVKIATDQRSSVSITLACENAHTSPDQPRFGTLLFATQSGAGWQSLDFPLENDTREHTYHLDMLAVSEWRGEIVAFGMRFSEAPSRVRLMDFRVADRPVGPAKLKLISADLDPVLTRAGQPAQLTVTLANRGAEVARDLAAELRWAGAAAAIKTQDTLKSVNTLGPDEEAEFQFRFTAAEPFHGNVSLVVTAAALAPVTFEIPVNIERKQDITRLDYVPEPKPVRGPYEVGVYYFPGWQTASQWHPVQRFPERKPLLGWYREGNPEVADWHIKWAVEHGITFFAYDWYWSKGARQLEHGLHDGYFKARYRHLLKFCLLWANHNAPGTSSMEDCLAVTRYWIENYFRRPEHWTVDGKPAVIIFSPDRLTEDMGSAAVKETFERMRAECRKAGLPGLYLLACVAHAGQARQAAEEGYDATTAYNWANLGMTGESRYAPYSSMIEGYRQHWEHLREKSLLPLLLPISGGWDSRPWHGENNLVRFGRTPQLFAQHLRDAKRLLDQPGITNVFPRAVLIEAWNEWGEGSYIEPHREFGFGYLDAVREVFAGVIGEHQDLVPQDVGRGPYDIARADVRQTSWDFARGSQGWENTMDLGDIRAADGAIRARSTGRDPAWFGPPLQAPTSQYGHLKVRMKLTSPDDQPFRDVAQFFWRTTRLPESEGTSVRFPVEGDGQWHEYRIHLAENPRWRGVVTRLRLDPVNRMGVQIELGAIGLER